MSNIIMSNCTKPQSSLCPTNGRQAVGDGALSFDAAPSVLAVCHMQGADDLYYYSTTFSGGPGKCPPDRGSSDWVTDSPARIFSTSPVSDRSSIFSLPEAEYFPKAVVYPPTPPPEDVHTALKSFSRVPAAVVASPQAIRGRVSAPVEELITPPLTPDDGEEGDGSVSAISAKQSNAALDFLTVLFPRNGLSALPYAKSVSISAPNGGATFDGVVLELPDKPKTFYVNGRNADSVNLRESITALLDLADEQLQCSALIIALERASPVLGDLLHALMYVGGTVVTKPPFQADPAFVLVGLEI
ncbi:hypothetical protein OE88DRAFT_1624727 [Heliocybe sulcata]|uniref:Ornithine decarboxylase antizyme n=1 Tax=Heliocybe sulcata TaxID=5364 RepID=A0A5C3NDZ3_9AGAM|nr:hypothetical protein OE88DRAFT_1624727 [Heliocybe sulcata]